MVCQRVGDETNIAFTARDRSMVLLRGSIKVSGMAYSINATFEGSDLLSLCQPVTGFVLPAFHSLFPVQPGGVKLNTKSIPIIRRRFNCSITGCHKQIPLVYCWESVPYPLGGWHPEFRPCRASFRARSWEEIIHSHMCIANLRAKYHHPAGRPTAIGINYVGPGPPFRCVADHSWSMIRRDPILLLGYFTA